MDDVGLENVDDLNELESRVYADLYHEARSDILTFIPTGAIVGPNPSVQRIVTTKSVRNTPVGVKRYWVERAASVPFGANNPILNMDEKTVTTTTEGGNGPLAVPKTGINEVRSQITTPAGSPSGIDDIDIISLADSEPADNISSSVPETNTQTNHQNETRPKFARAHAVEVLSPKTLRKFQEILGSPSPSSSSSNKSFEKAKKKKLKRMRVKQKQKNLAHLEQTKREPPIESIVLISSDESDIMEVPTPPPPLVIVQDSESDEDDSDDQQSQKRTFVKNPAATVPKSSQPKPSHVENGEVDNQPNCSEPTSTAFAKPQTQPEVTTKVQVNSSVKREAKNEIVSRCTSPSSVLSSDDFIGQTDHSRVLESAVVRDDPELQDMTDNISSATMSPPTEMDVTMSAHTEMDVAMPTHTEMDVTEPTHTEMDVTMSTHVEMDGTKSPHTEMDGAKSPHAEMDSDNSGWETIGPEDESAQETSFPEEENALETSVAAEENASETSVAADESGWETIVSPEAVSNEEAVIVVEDDSEKPTNSSNSQDVSNVEVVDVPESPEAASGSSKDNYRVDRVNSRAFDVYESESDSVYAKGAGKSALKRPIGSSSDENIENPALLVSANRTKKRLRKMRSSSDVILNRLSRESSDRESENDADNAYFSDTDVLMKGVTSTPLSYIAHGPAIDKPASLKRRRKGSGSITTRRSSASAASAGHMSDHDFIATLNTLAKCQGSDSNDSDVVECDADDEQCARSGATTFKAEVLKNLVSSSGGKLTADGVAAALSPASASADDVPSTSHAAAKAAELAAKAKVELAAQAATAPEEATESVEAESSLENSIVEVIYEPNPDDVQSETVVGPLVSRPEVAQPAPSYTICLTDDKSVVNFWNDEMRRFYNNSWRGESFSITALYRKMNPNKNLWRIRSEDRRPLARNYSIKCANCHEYGHFRQRCPETKKKPLCFMCGETGHVESRCPNAMCLRCGARTDYYTRNCNSCTFLNRVTCIVCQMRGHQANDCPDKWRRYHSTITSHSNTLNSAITYNTNFNCCVCGARGHLAENCRSASRMPDYPQTTIFIQAHYPVYEIQNFYETGTDCKILYDPNQRFVFNFPQPSPARSFYSRFLRAVGLPTGEEQQRKRKTEQTDRTVAQVKRTKQQFVLNPYSKEGRRALGAQSEQVPEVESTVQIEEILEDVSDESVGVVDVVDVVDDNGNCEVVELDSSPVEVAINDSATDRNPDNEKAKAVRTQPEIISVITIPSTVDEDNAVDNSDKFKAPTPVPTQHNLSKEKETEALLNEANSDSNYSFSEHFDVIPVGGSAPERSHTAPPQSKGAGRKPSPRKMEQLPEFISLYSPSDDIEEIANDCADTLTGSAGLSVKHVTSGDEDNVNTPCEAKIYLTRFHSDFLLSPRGNEFLVQSSKTFTLTVRLDWTSVGHVLVIFGLPDNQDLFHNALRVKYNELTNEERSKRFETNHNVPKRIDVIVRFLRENICQLFANLGNAKEMHNRLIHLEKQRSKSAIKQADRIRRLLNMILVGQAGLHSGDKHVEKLLLILKRLVARNRTQDTGDYISQELREEIEEHWKVIFTSHRHDNYAEMVGSYTQMEHKNHIPLLNLDPLLLGQRVLNTSLTDEQKQQMGTKPRVKTPPPPLISITPPKPILKQATQLKQPLTPTTSTTVGNRQKTRATPHIREAPPRTDPSPIAIVPAPSRAAPTPLVRASPYGPTPTVPQAGPGIPRQRDRRPNVNNTLLQAKLYAPARPGVNSRYGAFEPPPWRDARHPMPPRIDNRPLPPGYADYHPIGPVADAMRPSAFWSHESIKFINECLPAVHSTHQHMYGQMCQLRDKAYCGILNYNEYGIIVNMYNDIMSSRLTYGRAEFYAAK